MPRMSASVSKKILLKNITNKKVCHFSQGNPKAHFAHSHYKRRYLHGLRNMKNIFFRFSPFFSIGSHLHFRKLKVKNKCKRKLSHLLYFSEIDPLRVRTFIMEIRVCRLKFRVSVGKKSTVVIYGWILVRLFSY